VTQTVTDTLVPDHPRASASIKPLRILIALPGLHRVVRGAETAFEAVGRGLARLGNQVTMIGSGQLQSPEPYRFIHAGCIARESFERWPKVPYLRSHYAYEELTFAPGLLRAYHPNEYDITITCGYPYTNWILRRRSFNGRRRPPHVYVTQNGDWMVQARNAEYRHFSCDGLVCTNPDYFQRHKDRYRSVLIPNGVDPDVFHPGPADRARFGLPESVPIVLMVSALIESKRVEDGIRAVSQLPDVHLVVAGDGEHRAAVESLGQQLLPGRFRRITLPRQQMPDLYRAADVFLHMSTAEASANAYMEALATGLPIVTHDWAVTQWTLEKTGVLVDTTDEARCAAGVRQALALNSAADVEARRSLVQRRFGWASIAQSYDDFLRQIVEATA
jgi:glycosyltransferase involved in cell wall biosynthesis